MFAPTRYLQWALRFYGHVRFDLATSGIPSPGPRVLNGQADAVPEDVPAAWARLRQAIAACNGVTAAEALPALGATHALWLSCASLLSPGDEVLVESPAYEPLTRIAEGAGARVNQFQRRAEARFAIEPASIERAMTPRTRVVIVTNLHNPTGVRATDRELRDAALVAQEHGALLLVDEVYAPFDALIDDDGVLLGGARKLATNIVTVSSLTKCFGLGPERIGWVLGPADVIGRAADALLASAGALPRSHVQVALAAFSELPSLATRAHGLLAGKRDRVAAWVATKGVSWSGPHEGLFGLVTVDGRGDLTDTIEAAARERQVLVAPGAFFGVPNAFRIAWALPTERLEEGLERLAQALDL